MYPNLEAEMARNKITQSKIAEILGITPTTLSFKLSGKSSLSLKECVKIKQAIFPDKTLDYLFQTDEEKKTGYGVNKLNKKEIPLTEAGKAKKESRQAMYWSITALVISIITCVFVIMRILLS